MRVVGVCECVSVCICVCTGSRGGVVTGLAVAVGGDRVAGSSVALPGTPGPSVTWARPASRPATRSPVGCGRRPACLSLVGIVCLFVHLFSSQFRSSSHLVWRLSDPKEQKIRVGVPAVAGGQARCVRCPHPGPGRTDLPPGAGAPGGVARACEEVEAPGPAGAAWWRAGSGPGRSWGLPTYARSLGATGGQRAAGTGLSRAVCGAPRGSSAGPGVREVQ